MDLKEKINLGSTDLKVGRLGLSSSFGAPSEVYEEAFERGCNFFTWGTFIKGHSGKMKNVIRNITKKGKREDLVISYLTYAHVSFITSRYLIKALKSLGLDYIDVLTLGYYSKRPPQKIIDSALKLKEKGLVKSIGLTGHNRELFPKLHEEKIFDAFHIRYNAANRGAEKDAFPFLTGEGKPGIISFTATRWGQLLNPKKTPAGEQVPTAGDCYRFVLTNPNVDVCLMGVKNRQQLQDNLKIIEKGPMNEEELSWMRGVGDYVYGRK